MIYQVVANGTFNNITQISIDQTLSIKIKCTQCGEEHKNPVTITSDSHKLDQEDSKCNLLVKCGNCDNQMKLKIHGLTKNELSCSAVSVTSMFESKKESNSYILSEIECDRCNVIDVVGIRLYVFNGEEYFTPDMEQLQEEKLWVKINNQEEIRIEDFGLELRLTK